MRTIPKTQTQGFGGKNSAMKYGTIKTNPIAK
jgi:hypothetical protein